MIEPRNQSSSPTLRGIDNLVAALIAAPIFVFFHEQFKTWAVAVLAVPAFVLVYLVMRAPAPKRRQVRRVLVGPRSAPIVFLCADVVVVFFDENTYVTTQRPRFKDEHFVGVAGKLYCLRDGGLKGKLEIRRAVPNGRWNCTIHRFRRDSWTGILTESR